MRLIDADALPVKFDGHIVSVWKNDLDAAPTIDAAPVVHGEWITHNADLPFLIYAECSVCGFNQSISDTLDYCPYCGAKMDGGSNV